MAKKSNYCTIFLYSAFFLMSISIVVIHTINNTELTRMTEKEWDLISKILYILDRKAYVFSPEKNDWVLRSDEQLRPLSSKLYKLVAPYNELQVPVNGMFIGLHNEDWDTFYEQREEICKRIREVIQNRIIDEHFVREKKPIGCFAIIKENIAHVIHQSYCYLFLPDALDPDDLVPNVSIGVGYEKFSRVVGITKEDREWYLDALDQDGYYALGRCDLVDSYYHWSWIN